MPKIGATCAARGSSSSVKRPVPSLRSRQLASVVACSWPQLASFGAG